MNEQSHPYDPYRNEPGQPGADDQRGAFDGAPAQPADDVTADPYSSPAHDATALDGAPAEPADDRTGDPAAAHPHDPYAYQAGQQQSADPYAAPAAGGAAAGAGAAYGAPQGAGPAGQQPDHAAQQPGYAGQQGAGHGYQQGVGYGGQQGPAYSAQGAQGAQNGNVPPAGIKGVYDGPLSGQPTSDSDSRLWSMLSQLSVVLGHLFSWGFLGWVGPLIIFLVYKDRDRFIRYNAAEALNGAIAVVICQVVLSVVLGIFGVITLGFGFAIFPLVGVPALVQLVFSIIGAVKANQGTWWNYPVNIRLVK
ncbi:DUF4870 domain-containing protein [Brachybacterium muris]|uniref:DUF4870 domain-containing protein n=1 Tax=Brachybacterium muris TaxID=219301 RepID=UPI00223AA316|nr:DUF4870 domain-containing protein [Brachybacterium muris]MCT2261403.1 DUF4870 domain-containing protein [Brachybacterium muris]